MRSSVITSVVVTLLLSGFGLVTAQGTPSAPSSQDSTALLNEVRLLRRAIEALAGTSARVQIVFGRLQLQEQRTTVALKRLDEARAALAAMTKTMALVAERAKRFEDAATDSRLPDDEVRGIQQELEAAKREWAALEAERVRLVADESGAAALLAQEQGRWSDLNRQLEELERALAPRAQ